MTDAYSHQEELTMQLEKAHKENKGLKKRGADALLSEEDAAKTLDAAKKETG